MLRRVVALLIVSIGCSGDGLDYEGTPGQAIPVTLGGWVPRASVTVDNGEPRTLLVDTGAPLTVLDSDSFPVLRHGANTVNITGLGLSFRGVSAAVFDAFESSPAEAEIDGVIGGDILRHFSVSIDYQGGRVWLDEPGTSELPAGVAVDAVEPAARVDVDVMGGGLALLPGDCPGGCGTACISETRVVARVQLESLSEPVWMLVDTGASAVVLSPETMANLGTAGRPRLHGVTVATASGNAIAYLTRVGTMTLGSAEQVSVPVLVFDMDLFAEVSREVGRPIVGLVGGSYLRQYLTTIDYGESTLALARFTESSHIDPEEYVRVGFTMKRGVDGWVVADVYTDTAAAVAGLSAGDLVAEIDGTDISALDKDAVKVLLDQFSLGQQVPVGVLTATGIDVLAIEVEDLLPSYGGS